MAFIRNSISYKFEPSAKASMIMVLDQFGDDLTTIHETKEMLRVSGSVVLDAHYAAMLARLIAGSPYSMTLTGSKSIQMTRSARES